ncbi:hypothetical protein, partial [Pseudomonas aeruginosa]|uniref:hypothetical protein n=2 Tax=Pseudomonas aeruginosa TaxID=287 RepID=UPI001C12F526
HRPGCARGGTGAGLTEISGIPAYNPLREKVRGAARDMYQKEILSKDRVEVMERHCNEEGGMLNINTLQRYLHSTAYFPNGETLNSMWNEFKDYVIACW